jgi:DNA-binding MarR family transcriptional regulator
MTRSPSNPTGRRQLVHEVIEELRALASEMDALDQAVADRFGLNRTDMRCAGILSRDGPMQPKELAEAMGFTTGGITTVIDRLEESGYAIRRQDRNDRRKVLVESTGLSRRQAAPIYGGLNKRVEEQLSDTDDSELTTVRDFLRNSTSVLKDHTAGVRAGTARSLVRSH